MPALCLIRERGAGLSFERKARPPLSASWAAALKYVGPVRAVSVSARETRQDVDDLVVICPRNVSAVYHPLIIAVYETGPRCFHFRPFPIPRALRFRLAGGHVVPRIHPSTCAVAATVSGLGAVRQSLMLPLREASRIQEATAKASC